MSDSRIPRPLRWLAALGLLPIPGPFDEAVLLIVAVPLGLFYRRPLAEAWRRAGDPRFADPSQGASTSYACESASSTNSTFATLAVGVLD